MRILNSNRTERGLTHKVHWLLFGQKLPETHYFNKGRFRKTSPLPALDACCNYFQINCLWTLEYLNENFRVRINNIPADM